MKQREVQDENNVRWQCVQAFSGGQNVDEKKMSKLTQENGKVEVVCTPSGGEQTVRIKLEPQWEEKISDAQLLDAIRKNSNGNLPNATL
jgi:hypothetical protein